LRRIEMLRPVAGFEAGAGRAGKPALRLGAGGLGDRLYQFADVVAAEVCLASLSGVVEKAIPAS
jgi:hypothetical protein